MSWKFAQDGKKAYGLIIYGIQDILTNISICCLNALVQHSVIKSQFRFNMQTFVAAVIMGVR